MFHQEPLLSKFRPLIVIGQFLNFNLYLYQSIRTFSQWKAAPRGEPQPEHGAMGPGEAPTALLAFLPATGVAGPVLRLPPVRLAAPRSLGGPALSPEREGPGPGGPAAGSAPGRGGSGLVSTSSSDASPVPSQNRVLGVGRSPAEAAPREAGRGLQVHPAVPSVRFRARRINI